MTIYDYDNDFAHYETDEETQSKLGQVWTPFHIIEQMMDKAGTIKNKKSVLLDILITTKYADFWTDTILPDTNLIDVSEHFPGIVGHTIRRFQFYPRVVIEMDSGCKARFSTNYYIVNENEPSAAYFEFL